MARVSLILGGARSGKSTRALALATRPATFLATAQALDTEMAERIAAHKAERGPEWSLIEEPLEIAAPVAAHQTGTLVVDCLTLWLNNLMHHDRDVTAETGALTDALGRSGRVILVSNEVGLSIAPDNALARRFRDEQGRFEPANCHRRRPCRVHRCWPAALAQGRSVTTPALMIQGTGSNVGKSVLVAGLARAFTRRGLTVRPFKPQNMSNNAMATAEGGEIGRAQALQALACGTHPHTDMNPVLLKPETDRGAQVVVQGQRLTTVKAQDYAALKPDLLLRVMESFQRLSATADLVLVEGAGSPAEINLRAGDIANMGFAEAAKIPVILAGCIDRGGVIAQIVGTHTVLSAPDRARIRGFLINKFRGDPGLFDDGYTAIETATGWPGLGVIPWFADAARLPAEDAADIRPGRTADGLKIVCPMLSRIANFDDLDPLAQTPGTDVSMIRPGQPLPGDADLVILPGSKSTRGDLAFLREQGWDIDLFAHVRRGGRVLGVCGGYQMLGRSIADPQGIEGPPGTTPGLGLLDVETVMHAEKRLGPVSATHVPTGQAVDGYEIHIGRTDGPDCARPLFRIGDRPEGASTPDGRVQGAYLHGLFSSDGFREAYLRALGADPDPFDYRATIDRVLDALADHLEEHANLDRMFAIASGG